MEMKRSTAAVLLVLSLGALVTGRLAAAVADDDVDTIRLPSHGLVEELVAEKALKPPECCNLALCTRSQPPTCRCADQVKKCAKTCKSCQKVDGSSLYVCGDSYTGYPDPMCAKSVTAGPGFAFPEATAAVAATAETVSEKTVVDVGEEEARPWDCCDLVLCNRAFPPSCRCADNVKECAKTCKSCQKVEDSSRYMCFDWYQGSKGPACTPVPPPPAA